MSDTTVSFMLAVRDASEASQWYQQALGAIELWSLGSVRALEFGNAPFILHEPTDGFATPGDAGTTTVRLEVLTSDPDSIVARAVEAGADGSRDLIRDHEMPWGIRRAGGFRDPFGHVWIVGDRSPLNWRGSVSAEPEALTARDRLV
jgi:uncharacterized glyoxalase superfamily protein PhnB